MTQLPIYLDYMATTPIDPRVVDVMVQYMGPDGHFGNAASATHVYGRSAAQAIDHARSQVASVIGGAIEDIVFTSGATEANNLAILGAARFYQRKGRHAITMSTEHRSVLDCFRQLEREGFQVTYLQPQSDGLLDLSSLLNMLRKDTVLVSIMQVNNEIGVVQNIQAIGELLRGKGIVFHVDAAQSVGKLSINLKKLSVDLMSFSAHKNYGPKGVGALYVRHQPRIRLQPQSFGGGHEGGLRSGTLPTHQIVGMGEALALSETLRIEEQARILCFRERLWEGIRHIPGIHLNGSAIERIAGNLNFSVHGVEGDALLPALSQLALSTTSACSSASSQPSFVLRALGVSPELAKSTIRLSMGRFTTEEHINAAVALICSEVPKLRSVKM
jgi:cysteine desulfurase